VIRDERDYKRQVDYLPDNPVKLGHVTKGADWPYSSFHRYVRCDIYNFEWEAVGDVRGMEME
jgi:putative transposase